MTDKEFISYTNKVKARTKKITSSKKNAQEYLQKTGIYTPSGNLSSFYK